jgi:hypothetical protein
MDHRQRRKWQPFISFGVIVVAFVALYATILGTWKFMMPPSGQHTETPPLTEFEQNLSEQLKEDVFALSDQIGERNVFRSGTMEQTAGWIISRFTDFGYEPEIHTHRRSGIIGAPEGGTSDNIIAEVTGTNTPEKIIIIGAHYDSVVHSPGANDNASAVAVMMALAATFVNQPQPKTVRFVAFANEEPPFFKTENMGSYAYAARSRDLGEDITAMMALDGLGFFSDEPGSQSYPFPGIGLMYPDKANFIGFVTRLRDTSLLNRVTREFQEHATIPAEGAALPGFIPGVSWSDHWSFWQHGYSAFLVTDTLLFRDPYYHTSSDTPERLDYESMARVTVGLQKVIEMLAS